jgi:hypothetical protein
MHAGAVKGLPGAPPTDDYIGVAFDPAAKKYSLHVRPPTSARSDVKNGKAFVIHFEDSERAARAYDCVQLLLYGPFATTNFPYTAYTQAHLQSAADKLRQAGCDVHAAIAAAQRAAGPCAWVRICPGGARGEWVAPVELVAQGQVITIDIGPFLDARSAARAADAALLVLQGPKEGRHPCLNFPLASYSGEVQSSRDALVDCMKRMAEPGGAHKQREAELLEKCDSNIRVFNQVGGTCLVVGAVACLVCVFMYWDCCRCQRVLCWIDARFFALVAIVDLELVGNAGSCSGAEDAGLLPIAPAS